MANDFIFKGSLDRNSKAPLFAFRLGIYRQDWPSLDARSLQELVFETETKSKAIDPKTKKKKNLLQILIERDSKLKRWFEVMKNPKRGSDDKLWIYLYTNQDQSVETTTFVFHGAKVSGEPEGHNPGLVFTFDYGDMNIHGSRG